MISARGKKYIEDGVQLRKMTVREGEVEEIWEGIDGEPCKLVEGFKEINDTIWLRFEQNDTELFVK